MKVDIEALRMKANLVDKIHDAYLEAEYKLQAELNEIGMFCKTCGETDPEHNFYPLMGELIGPGVPRTLSMYECNKCARTKEDYEEIFGEKKKDKGVEMLSGGAGTDTI